MLAEEILDNAAYITLFRRSARTSGFETRYAEATEGRSARRFYGFDGQKLTPPEGWKTSRGAFGCCLAHVYAWAATLSDYCFDLDKPFLFMEDDAVFCDGFLRKLELAADLVPDNYDVFYLGGEHLLGSRRKPEKIADASFRDYNVEVVRAYNVNRLHAYVVKGAALHKIMPRLVRYLSNAPTVIGPSGDETCFDYEVGRMTEDGTLTVYAANPFLVGQGGFGSDTYPSKSVSETRFWQLNDF